MEKELEIEKLMTQIVLDVVKNAKDTTVKVFCEENHIARERMTSNFFTLKNGTLFRIMMGIAQLAPLKEYLDMCIRIAIITYLVANQDDGTAEDIKKAHEGSPIGKKREKTTKKNSKSNKTD